MEFYYDNLSQPCRALYIFMKLNNIHFIPKYSSFFTNDRKSAAVMMLNPLGKLPTLKDGDLTLIESNAMLKYLATTRGVPDHWYPKDVKAQARIDEFLSYNQAAFRPKMLPYIYNLTFASALENKPVDEELVTKVKPDMLAAFDIFEKYFMDGRDFIAGGDISIADLQAVCEISQIDVATPVKVTQGRLKMAAWMERVKSRLAPYYEEAHRDLHQYMVEHPDITKQKSWN